VTFKINTSTMNDYRWTDSTAVIQARGGIRIPGGHDQTVLKWNDSSPEFTNDGGEYLSTTVAFPDSFIGDTLDWKIGATLTNLDGTPTDFWENYAGNRGEFPLPDHDTTLALAYVSATEPPYTPSDSVDLYFRINMAENTDFDQETGTPVLSMVGHIPEWNPGAHPLTREGDSDFWSLHLKLAQGYIDTVENIKFDAGWPESARGMHMYRFALGAGWDNTENLNGKYWDGNENRVIYLKNTTKDTTIAWKWWNDAAAKGFEGNDTVHVTFNADMTAAIENYGFTAGDTVIVRMGYENSADAIYETVKLEKSGLGAKYAVDTTIVTTVNADHDLYYSYYIIKFGNDQKETFYDFSNSEAGAAAERRRVKVTSKELVVSDIETDPLSLRRQPLFPNNTPLLDTVTVVFTCDLRPAWYQVNAGSTLKDIQGVFDVAPIDLDSIMTKWGVRINHQPTDDWIGWGFTLQDDIIRTMHDDGTHGDKVAGDSIYSVTFGYSACTTKGREFKFGIRGGDNEGGYGNNHVENIDDSDEIIYVESQFGSIDPVFYSTWDYENQRPVTSIGVAGLNLPKHYKLDQNYPNPFNPNTRISYQLPNTGKVSLVIYNVLGQKVRTLFEGNANAGTHYHVWNGRDNFGSKVATGVYFYKLEAEGFTAIKKMVLVK
jgi:hypothetical protein